MKIYQNLISIIEDHADEITNDLVKEFRKKGGDLALSRFFRGDSI